jgi:hypothetical protein
MPIDWGSLINLGAGIAGSVASNRAEAGGIQLSQEALDKAKAEAAAAYGQAGTAAANAIQQGQGNQQAALDYGYTNAANQLGQGYDAANKILPWGYQQGRADRATGLANSLGSLATGYGNAFNILNPYAQSGVQALNQANNLVFGKGTPGGGGMPTVSPMPATQFASQIPMPAMPSAMGVKPMAVTPIKASSLADSSLAGLAGLGSGVSGYGNGSALASQSLQNSSVRGTLGALGGIGVGAGLSALGLATASIPLLAAVPFVGPILAGVGALIGKLWNNHNPDKAWASNAINEVSNETWGPNHDGKGGLSAAVAAGQITPAQAKTAFQGLWQGWIQAMQKAGVDQSIIDRSIESQSKYFAGALDGSWFEQYAPKGEGTPPVSAAQGGMVPGEDKGKDTVPAMLRGGEFVVRPEAVHAVGVNNLRMLNSLSSPMHYADGGSVSGDETYRRTLQDMDSRSASDLPYVNYVHDGYSFPETVTRESANDQAKIIRLERILRAAKEMQKRQKEDEKLKSSNPQHFATGGAVKPYDPNNPNATQNWDTEMNVAAQGLPSGYATYQQGYNPVTNQWEYNPNTGEKYIQNPAGGVPLNFSTRTPQPAPATNTLAAGMPQAGDPNYYKYLSVGSSPYAMPTPTTTTATGGAPLAGANYNATLGAPGPNVANPYVQGGPMMQPPPNIPSTTTKTTDSVAVGASRNGGAGQSVSNTGTPSASGPTRGAGTAGGSVWSTAPQIQNAVASRQSGMGLFTPQPTAGNPTNPVQPANPVNPVGGGYTSPGGAGNSSTGTTQFPSNWNVNNVPLPDVLNMQGTNGASYETSPLYQWQLAQGEKNINRALQARGRYNSTYGLNTLSDFYRTLGANEAQQNYNRTMDLTRLGLEASMAQAGQQAQYGNQASSLYQAAANGDANAAQSLASQLGVNAQQYSQLLATLTQKYGGDVAQAQTALGAALANVAMWQGSGMAQNTWNWANPYAGNNILGGNNNAMLATSLGNQNYGSILKALGIGVGSSTGPVMNQTTGYGIG